MSLLSRLSMKFFRGQRILPFRKINRHAARQLSLTTRPLCDAEKPGQGQEVDKVKEGEEEVDLGPVMFTTSKARGATAMATYMVAEPPPWYQPLIAVFTLASVILYCVMRQPNDLDKKIDEIFTVSLPMAEEERLRMEIDIAELHGENASELKAQLAACQQITLEGKKEVEARWKDIERKAITK